MVSPMLSSSALRKISRNAPELNFSLSKVMIIAGTRVALRLTPVFFVGLIQKVDKSGIVACLPNTGSSTCSRTLAIVFCAVVAILIWLISLNIDVVANSIHKLLGNERKARSGFEQLMQIAITGCCRSQPEGRPGY